MTEIVFVRHGQASFGSDDYDKLSPLGWEQSRWLGAHLAELGFTFDAVATGAMRRHRETAAGIAETRGYPKPIETPALNEFDFVALLTAWRAMVGGVADPLAAYDFKHFLPDLLAAWAADAIDDAPERWSDFEARIGYAIENLRRFDRVLIVSSGGPKAALARVAMGVEVADMAGIMLQIHNASYSRFRAPPNALLLDEFNATPHFDRPDRAHARTFL